MLWFSFIAIQATSARFFKVKEKIDFSYKSLYFKLHFVDLLCFLEFSPFQRISTNFLCLLRTS